MVVLYFHRRGHMHLDCRKRSVRLACLHSGKERVKMTWGMLNGEYDHLIGELQRNAQNQPLRTE